MTAALVARGLHKSGEQLPLVTEVSRQIDDPDP